MDTRTSTPDTSTPSIASVLEWARAYIPIMEARILLRHVLNCSSAHLSAWPEKPLDNAVWQNYKSLVERRASGEPVAYLTELREFYGRDFTVTPAVLIPRPDTELLIELALAYAPAYSPLRILDLGTGSGVLAVTLALELPHAQITAVDRMHDALDVAKTNAERFGADVALTLSDWFGALHEEQRFQIIVTNPPYIPSADGHLEQGDLRFEPSSALVSGPSGLDDLLEIIMQAPHYLEAGGRLFVEHGYDQAYAVRGILTDAGFSEITSWRDLSGIERVSGGCWLGHPQ